MSMKLIGCVSTPVLNGGDRKDAFMSFLTSLTQSLQAQTGWAGSVPLTISARDAAVDCEVDVTAIDRLSCSIAEIRLGGPFLANATYNQLQDWARNFSRKITYLLEELGPLEFDPQAGQVLVRSIKPDTLPDGTAYFEVMLELQTGTMFSMKRYRYVKGQPGRNPIDMHLTVEVLSKLLNDLVISFPAVP
jgi:hypothetical protein